MLFNIYVLVSFVQLFFVVIQTEVIYKKPKSYFCEYGFSKKSNIKCDGNKAMKCQTRCDFINQCDDKSDEINCGECDFTQNMCGWKNVNKSSLLWIRVDDNNGKQCPDGENGTCVLSLMKVKSNNNNTTKADNRARLQSPKFQSTSESCHFKFEYKHNENDCLLSVRLVNDNRKLWFRDRLNLINQNDKDWRTESVDIMNVEAGHQLEFLVTCDEKLTNRKPNKSFLQIAFRNISWNDCEKNSNKSLDLTGFDCDFKSNLCNKWTDFELTNDNFLHWKRSNDYQVFGNTFDHKLNEYFVFTEKYDRKNRSEIARLSSLKQKSIQIIKSLSFDYLMTNANESSLYLLIKSGNGDKKEIWRSKPFKPSKWQNACINITDNFNSYQLIFEAHFETINYGIVAIKNITESENEFCISDNISKINDFEYSTSEPSILTVTELISNTTFGILTNYAEIPNSSLLSSEVIGYKIDAQHENYTKIESYAWILKGTAFLIIVLIFISIKFWQNTRRGQQLLPLIESYDMIDSQSINSSPELKL